MRRPRRTRVLGITLATLLSLAGAGCRSGPPHAGPAPARPYHPTVGAYLGAGAKGIARLSDWERWTGVPARYGIDFEAADSWATIAGQDWLLNPWRDWVRTSERTLVLSVPMLPVPTLPEPVAPVASHATLHQCGTGAYDWHWTQLGHQLVAHQLASTVVRPGWEFNGSWYPWSAQRHVIDFIACFRHLVTSMRTAAGHHFQFMWNPALGAGSFPAELAFPGLAYVDLVGIDVYDVSWLPGTYPIPAEASAAERARRINAAWRGLESGDHGLRFWSAFAREIELPLAIPEWGLASRPDGRGGGDNPYFVDRLMTSSPIPPMGSSSRCTSRSTAQPVGCIASPIRGHPFRTPPRRCGSACAGE
jgi:hypothetical protein